MRIFPLGETALTIEFGNAISLELNERSIALAEHFSNHPFPGMVEAVPAYSSVTIFYDMSAVRKAFPEFPSAFDAVSNLVNKANSDTVNNTERRTVEIPVRTNEECSPDLQSVAEFAGLSGEQVLDVFLSRTYRVHMLGFLPGFAYMGEVDERIAAPRLSTPRTKVPQGSVGIAGKQTGIYPLESPGGWRIIGRTDLKMFDPHAAEPCLLRAGDEVRFTRH